MSQEKGLVNNQLTNLGFRVRNRDEELCSGDDVNPIVLVMRPQQLLSKDVGRQFILK